MATTKLDRLKNTLCSVLLECKNECVNDAVEWQVYDDLIIRRTDRARVNHLPAVQHPLTGQTLLRLRNHRGTLQGNGGRRTGGGLCRTYYGIKKLDTLL